MRDRILTIFLLILAAVTVWAVVTELPQKEYAQPSADFSNSLRGDIETAITTAVSAGQLPGSPAADTSSTAVPAVSSEVIRLHILADSDNESDQAIKLAVRDILLPYLNAATLGAATKEEALQQLEQQCGILTEAANQTLSALGADYEAAVSVETLYFPIRIYGSQTYLSEDAVIFPPGFYDSVQVVLGSGQGHNWWCLAYPSLCFIDATYDYIPKESDLYKIKLGSLEQTELLQLFYGSQAESFICRVNQYTELPGNTDKTVPQKADNNSSSEASSKIDIYLGSKLWELLKNFPFLLHK